jgi:hypothetical protein
MPSGAKRSGHEADHPPQSSAEVVKVWSYTSTIPHMFIMWCLIKRRENLTFYHTSMSEILLLCISFVSMI